MSFFNLQIHCTRFSCNSQPLFHDFRVFSVLHNFWGANMVEINRIDSLAKEKGIKASFICSKIGKSESYLRQIRAGRSNISEDVLAQIAEVLDTTTDYLHGKTDIKKDLGKTEVSDMDSLFLNGMHQLSPEDQLAVLAYIHSLRNK